MQQLSRICRCQEGLAAPRSTRGTNTGAALCSGCTHFYANAAQHCDEPSVPLIEHRLIVIACPRHPNTRRTSAPSNLSSKFNDGCVIGFDPVYRRYRPASIPASIRPRICMPRTRSADFRSDTLERILPALGFFSQ